MHSDAFGCATIAEKIAAHACHYSTLAPYAATIGISIVVIVITYLSLIIGGLVPKRIARNKCSQFEADDLQKPSDEA